MFHLQKDYNSGYAKDLLKRGIEFCLRDVNPDISEEQLEKMKKTPNLLNCCHINNLTSSLSESFKIASSNLIKDGFQHFYDDTVSPEKHHVECSGQTQIIDTVKRFMAKFDHRLYRGMIYKKPKDGNYEFLYNYKQQALLLLLILEQCSSD